MWYLSDWIFFFCLIYFLYSRLEPPQQRIGLLAPNNLLNNAEKLYKDKLEGPETFQIYNGELYTSLATGEIVKVSQGGHITFVTKIGQPCSECCLFTLKLLSLKFKSNTDYIIYYNTITIFKDFIFYLDFILKGFICFNLCLTFFLNIKANLTNIYIYIYKNKMIL